MINKIFWIFKTFELYILQKLNAGQPVPLSLFKWILLTTLPKKPLWEWTEHCNWDVFILKAPLPSTWEGLNLAHCDFKNWPQSSYMSVPLIERDQQPTAVNPIYNIYATLHSHSSSTDIPCLSWPSCQYRHKQIIKEFFKLRRERERDWQRDASRGIESEQREHNIGSHGRFESFYSLFGFWWWWQFRKRKPRQSLSISSDVRLTGTMSHWS